MPKSVTRRLIARESNGAHIGTSWYGISRVILNPDNPTLKASATKRLCSKPPIIAPRMDDIFKQYVDVFLNTFLTPLAFDTDLSFETWIQNTNYPMTRKQELQQVFDRINGKYQKSHNRTKCFMKEEEYDDFDKHARGIFSRVDEFKVNLGPCIKQIENVLYKRPEFVKHIPVSERPAYLSNLLGGIGNLFETDYTAFESHFTEQLMEITDLRFFRYMTKQIPNDQCKVMADSLSGINKLSFRSFSYEVEASRLSGEMTTSCFNGFANWVANSLVVSYTNWYKELYGIVPDQFYQIPNFDKDWVLKYYKVMAVEGDDGLCRNHIKPNVNLFKQLGLTIKMEEHFTLGDSKFCGILYDEETKDSLTSPIKQIINFGWVGQRYVGSKATTKLSLLRCKALSLLSSFPNCPIIAPAAKAYIRLTNRYHANAEHRLKTTYFDDYKRSTFKMPVKDIVPKISDGSRNTIFKHFGISPERQATIEAYFNNLTKIEPIPIDLLRLEISNDFIEFSNRYVYALNSDETKRKYCVSPQITELSLQRELNIPKWKKDVNPLFP